MESESGISLITDYRLDPEPVQAVVENSQTVQSQAGLIGYILSTLPVSLGRSPTFATSFRLKELRVLVSVMHG